MESEKRLVISDKILNAKGDSKNLYGIISALTGTKAENPMKIRRLQMMMS